MSSEIERKFLLAELPGWLADRAGVEISQGYLSNGEGAEIRLRRAGEQTLLTVKTGAGEVREETEVALAPELFESLWELTEGRRLTKTRRRESLDDGPEAEVDAYSGELAGLVVAEVEFDSLEASSGFRPPTWLGREVTGDPRYANRQLAIGGAPTTPEEPRKAPSRTFRVRRREEVAEALPRVVRGRAAKAAEALREELESDPAGAVHSARKELKKIRAVLRLARAGLGEETYGDENRRYRDAGRALSGRRDAVVKVATLTALAERFGSAAPSASVWGWRRMLERERDEAGAAAPDAATVAAVAAAFEQGSEAAAGWSLDGSWKLLGPGLERAYRDGRRAMDALAADPDPELVHAWRKRSKDLWYDLRLLRGAWPALLEPTVESAHELSELLGDHHDLTVLRADLATRAEVGGKQRLAELIERRQAELLEAALALGSRLYAERPKAFRRRVRAYWVAWRQG